MHIFDTLLLFATYGFCIYPSGSLLRYWGNHMMIVAVGNHTMITPVPVKQPWRSYRQISNITRSTSQNLNVFRLVLQLSLCNPLKQGVKSIMKMLLDRRCSKYIWVINNFIALGAPYIKGLTVSKAATRIHTNWGHNHNKTKQHTTVRIFDGIH